MGLIDRLFRARDRDAAMPLYTAVVARGRAPHWYVAGAVPDTIDGRFDMIAAILALVLIRLERDPEGAAQAASLAERFVDDMDAQVRQIGFGDVVVGKQIGQMMAMLGGRLGAYRDAITPAALDSAIARNLYRGTPPTAAAVAHVRDALLAFRAALDTHPLDALLAGKLP